MRVAASLMLATLLATTAARADGALLNPGYHHPDEDGVFSGALHDATAAALAKHAMRTLPNWTQHFQVAGRDYSASLLGSDPATGAATTIIPTVLVPIRLTLPDTVVNGAPLVLDATSQMKDVLNSPIFTAAKFDSGELQFIDAMLHAEFPKAPRQWHLTFQPSVAATMDITLPAASVQVSQAKSGKYLAVVLGNAMDKPIFGAARRQFSPDTLVVFITYNALDASAYGYHSNILDASRTQNMVFAYTSWLIGVDDLFSLPSPDADTFAHEIAEVVHDAFGTSRTREWGDWFNNNRCFQNYIETGDAVEDASAKIQNYKQKVTIDGRLRSYTLQTEAMLPWFERQFPSTALHQAYSFPGENVLLGPAPVDCVK